MELCASGNQLIRKRRIIKWRPSSPLLRIDGNDSFDSKHYAAYTQYFNSSLLVNFLAGGAAANDTRWRQAA